jgi:hypothetical protein
MDGFRKAVKTEMEKEKKPEILKNVPYLVKVEVSDLNIRKGPGTTYERTGKYTGAGTFTIVEEVNGPGASKWGRLKSGAGWIALDYAKVS